MKTHLKFTCATTILLGLFMLTAGGVFSQSQPESRKNIHYSDFRSLKGRKNLPASGIFNFAQREKQGVLQEMASAQDNSHVKLAGRWANGPCYTVATDSNYVYFNNGGYLEIASLKETSGKVLGKIVLPSVPEGIIAKGQTVFVADWQDGLRIIDVSDPAHPVETGFLDTKGHAIGVTVSGKYAYVADDNNGLRIIDVSDPAHPVETGFLDTKGYAIGVTVSGKYAYVADDNDGLRIIDVSDPAHPVETGFLDTKGTAYGVTLSGKYAYVADGKDGLRIIDVNDPAHPVETGSADTTGHIGYVIVSEKYAYVADWWDGLHILDISDPAHPVETGLFDIEDGAGDVAMSGQNIYAVSSKGLQVINIANPSKPAGAGFFGTGDYAFDVSVSGQYAYVADGDNGLHIINVNDPAHPIETGFLDTRGTAYGVTLSGKYAYVADWQDGLRIIDVSDPAHPVEVGFDTVKNVYDVTLSGKYAYLADQYDGMCIVEVSDPAHPVEISSFTTKGCVDHIAISGKYAYIADQVSLSIVDVSDPTHPVETGSFTKDIYDPLGVIVSGKYAYVADGVEGLSVVDVSNPAHPVETGFFKTGFSANDVTLSGKYAYVADFFHGLRVINICDPSRPEEAGFFGTRDGAYKISTSGKYVYVAGMKDGLYILEPESTEYFVPAWSENPYQPMKILIDTLILPDSGLQPNDEVGLFDKDSAGNDICVGAGTVLDTVSSKHPLCIVAATDDPATPKTDGFTNQNQITFKVWSAGAQKEYTQYCAKYNSAFDSVFSSSDTALVALDFNNVLKKPQTPQGQMTVLEGTDQTSDYTVPAVKYAKTYTWGLYPDKAGSIAGDDTTGTVTWNSNYTGTEAYVFVTVSNGSCGSVSSDSLKIRLSPLGIPQHADGKNILVAPNPTRGDIKITLKDNTQNYNLFVINQMGEIIMEEKLKAEGNQHQFSLNLGELPTGIYYLRFVNKEGVIIKKVLISK